MYAIETDKQSTIEKDGQFMSLLGQTAENLGPRWLRLTVFFLVAALLIFVLPFAVPPQGIASVSVSYLAGFNNRVAVFAAAGLSVAVFLFYGWTRRGNEVSDRLSRAEGLREGFVGAVVGVSALLLSLGGWCVATSHMRYLGDAGYIIEQSTVRQEYGRALYTGIEFAYGPLLLLPQVWLSDLLHCSMTAAYFAVLVVESSLGLLMLAYVLNALPIRPSLRNAGLVLLALGAITPHLGLNYTYFRFASPFAALLFATKERGLWRCTLLLAAAEAFELLISPELGLALAVGIVLFSGLRAWEQGRRWLLAMAVPLGVLAALLLTFGRPYLRMAQSFSQGALNLPLGPYPHLLVLLFALVWLVPSGLGQMLPWRNLLSARVLAVYGTGLAMMPAALGRCDPLHVVFNGVGVLVLSLVAVSRSSRPVRLAWVAAMGVLVGWSLLVNQRPFELRTAEVLRQAVMPRVPAALARPVVHLLGWKRADLAAVLSQPPQPEFHLDTAALEALVGAAPVSTPFEVSPAVEGDMIRSHHYSPGYYAFGVDVHSAGSEGRWIQEIDAGRWMLLPANWAGDNPHTLAHLAMLQGFSLPFRQRRAPLFVPNVGFRANLESRWVPVRSFGPYMLYEQRPGPGCAEGTCGAGL